MTRQIKALKSRRYSDTNLTQYPSHASLARLEPTAEKLRALFQGKSLTEIALRLDRLLLAPAEKRRLIAWQQQLHLFQQAIFTTSREYRPYETSHLGQALLLSFDLIQDMQQLLSDYAACLLIFPISSSPALKSRLQLGRQYFLGEQNLQTQATPSTHSRHHSPSERKAILTRFYRRPSIKERCAAVLCNGAQVILGLALVGGLLGYCRMRSGKTFNLFGLRFFDSYQQLRRHHLAIQAEALNESPSPR
jgi:hypothetical protein